MQVPVMVRLHQRSLAFAAAIVCLLVAVGAVWLSSSGPATSGPSSSPPVAAHTAVGSNRSAAALPTYLPESNLGAAETTGWLGRATVDALKVVPSGDQLVPSMVNYDPRLSVIILRDCTARNQVLLQYVGNDPTRARLSWTDYPSAKGTAPTESERLACGW
jgi:hypothetical protein